MIWRDVKSFPTAAMRPEDRAGAPLPCFSNDPPFFWVFFVCDEFFPLHRGLGATRSSPGPNKARRRQGDTGSSESWSLTAAFVALGGCRRGTDSIGSVVPEHPGKRAGGRAMQSIWVGCRCPCLARLCTFKRQMRRQRVPQNYARSSWKK